MSDRPDLPVLIGENAGSLGLFEVDIPAYRTALIETRRDKYGPAADPAIESHARPDDCARVAGWIGRFLDG